MGTHLFFAIWGAGIIGMVTFLITSSMLVFRLRDRYPDIYEELSRPSALTRNVNCIWYRKTYIGKLAPDDAKLVRINVGLFYFGIAAVVFIAIFVGFIAFGARS